MYNMGAYMFMHAYKHVAIVWVITGIIPPNQPAALKTVLSEAGGGGGGGNCSALLNGNQ